jgi:phenylacetic acid degradation operon negative regulatory protein
MQSDTKNVDLQHFLCQTRCPAPHLVNQPERAKPDRPMSQPLEPHVHRLLARFHRQRPLRAGSLLITIFGDAIAPRGAAATLGSLIQLAAPFGLTERLVRTSVARLAQDDWLTARRDGRLSEYRLSENGAGRFSEATRRIYGENPESWDGRWTLLLLASGDGRDCLRDELLWLGFGQLNSGVLAHPTRSPADTREQLRAIGAKPGQAIVLESTSGDLAADREIARLGWDLADLEQRYARYVRAFDPVRQTLEHERPDPKSAFVLRTLLIHEYRRIHLRDPLLPLALLPQDWVGATTYLLTREIYLRVFDAADSWLSATASTLAGPLPKSAPEARRRFAG